MAFVVGLDIGTHTLKGAVLSGTPRKYRLIDFFVEDIPSMRVDSMMSTGAAADDSTFGELDTPLSVEEFIQKVLRERGLQNADIVTAFDAKDCGIREFPVPFTRDDQIQKTIAFEAEQHFLAFDIDEVMLEWLKVGETDGKSHLVLFAARNEQIEDQLAMLKRVDVDPIALDLDAAAMANAFSLSPYFDATKSTLLIDMGATSTKIILLEGGKLKKIRALRSGSSSLDARRMIAEPATAGARPGDAAGGAPNSLGGGEATSPAEGGLFGDDSIESRFQEIEAALRRLEPVSSEQFDLGAEDALLDSPIAILSDEDFDRVSDAERADAATSEPLQQATAHTGASSGEPGNYQDYIERIGIEIQRTFATTQLDSPIELICLTGGLSRREEAKRFFQEEFDIDTVQLDFGEALAGDLNTREAEQLGSEGAVALGLAAKGMGTDLLGIDFRKGPFRYEHRLEKIRLPLLNCAVLCFFVFLQTAFWSYQNYLTLKNTAVGYEQAAAEAYKTFFGKAAVAGVNPVDSAERRLKSWEDGGLGDEGRFLPFDEVVRNVSAVMESTKMFFTLNSLELKLRLQKRAAARKKGTKKGAARNAWRTSKSTLAFLTGEQNANLRVENAFKSGSSKWFSAKANQQRDRRTDEFKVTVDLEVKRDHLKP